MCREFRGGSYATIERCVSLTAYSSKNAAVRQNPNWQSRAFTVGVEPVLTVGGGVTVVPGYGVRSPRGREHRKPSASGLRR